MQSRTVVLMLDADGCFYNEKYTKLLLNIIDVFGQRIIACVDNDDDASALEDRDKLINEIELSVCTTSLSSISIRHDIFESILFKKDREAFKRYLAKSKRSKSDEAKHNFIIHSFIQRLDQLSSQIMDLVFCRANEAFTEYLINKIRNDEITEIILISGSNRQSFFLDNGNSIANGTRLFCHDLTMYARELKVVLPIEIKVDKFLMCDILSDRPIGESFDKIIADKESKSDEHAKTTFDETKLTLILATSHYLAITYQDRYLRSSMYIEFHDDREDILDSISAKLTEETSRLLPEKLTIHLNRYLGSLPVRRNILLGTGHVESSYIEQIKKIIRLCQNTNQPEVKKIDAANQLDIDDFLSSHYPTSIIDEEKKYQPTYRFFKPTHKAAELLELKYEEKDESEIQLNPS